METRLDTLRAIITEREVDLMYIGPGKIDRTIRNLAVAIIFGVHGRLSVTMDRSVSERVGSTKTFKYYADLGPHE